MKSPSDEVEVPDGGDAEPQQCRYRGLEERRGVLAEGFHEALPWLRWPYASTLRPNAEEATKNVECGMENVDR